MGQDAQQWALQTEGTGKCSKQPDVHLTRKCIQW